MRICELALVLLVAFGSPVLRALWYWWIGDVAETPVPVGSLVNSIQRQAVELALLAYVLFRRGQTFRDLGLTFRWIDLAAAGLLYFALVLVHSVAHGAVNWITLVAANHPASFGRSHEHVAGVATIAFSVL